MSSRNNPSTWNQYERGISPHGSISSQGGRSVQFREDESLLDGEDVEGHGDHHDSEWAGRLRRRRSSVTMRLQALGDIGGVNSIRSFTRSWQRAASFAEVIPQRPAFVFAPDQAPIGVAGPSAPGEAIQYGRSHVDAGSLQVPRQSLLRQHLEAGPLPSPVVEVETPFGGPHAAAAAADEHGATTTAAGSSEQQQQQQGQVRGGAGDFRERERKSFPFMDNELSRAFSPGSGTTSTSIFAVPPHLATPIIGSYGSYRSMSYGTIRSEETPSPLTTPAAAAAAAAAAAGQGGYWGEEDGVEGLVGGGEFPLEEAGPPILVKEVEQDGKMVLTVEGQSTVYQTMFNSINVLIGVGLLSLPMGIKYAGWVCGMGFLTLAAAVTAYTASLLARCMDLDASLITFSDLAFISFGHRARLATSILFTLELLAACVALIVLFADSLGLLFPGLLTVTQWKVFCALILVPLHFMPLRLLSYSSVLGIFSCFSIVLIVIINGLIKQETPGSLIEPAATYLFPSNWLTLPLSFGLLMSPWGGHGVFPNIYRDMRHPYKYGQAVKVTFSFTYLLDAATAVAGILMFGDDVLDAITSNILSTTGYPRAATFLMCAFIAIIPLTKIPLNARPIVTTLEVLLGVYQHPHIAVGEQQQQQDSATSVAAMRVAIRVATVFAFLVISILFPAFDRIMAFMGSALCFSICVTLPIAFYLKLFGKEISTRERVVASTIMVASTMLSVVGTVWAFLPRSLIGAE